MVGGFAVVLAALYRTISDVFHHLPEDWVEDILAEEGDGEAAARTERPADRGGDGARSGALVSRP